MPANFTALAHLSVSSDINCGDMVHVPYRGSPRANVDLISRQVQVMFDTLVGSLPHIQTGRQRQPQQQTLKWPRGRAGLLDKVKEHIENIRVDAC